MSQHMPYFTDAVIVEPQSLETDSLVALYLRLNWAWFICLIAEQGSYEDRIESEPTANALSAAEVELVRRAANGDMKAIYAVEVLNVSPALYFREVRS